jgi:hypothetical protein
MLMNMFLPHLIASIVASKLSSKITRSAEFLAALHPDPIAKPIVAYVKTATSLIPSPVHPTFKPCSLSPSISKSLSAGVALERTLRSSRT